MNCELRSLVLRKDLAFGQQMIECHVEETSSEPRILAKWKMFGQ